MSVKFEYIYVFPQPYATVRMWHKIIFLSGVRLVWNQFSLSKTSCQTKAKEPRLLYYLPVAEERRTDEFIPKTKTLV